MAIKEKHLPHQLENFKNFSKFVFMILFLISIVLFIVEKRLNSSLENKFADLDNYSKRSLAIDDITLESI